MKYELTTSISLPNLLELKMMPKAKPWTVYIFFKNLDMLNTHGHISKSYTCHVHCVFMFFISTINITINIITNNYMLTIAISILHSNQKFKLARVLLLSTSGFSEDSENRRASCINRYSPDAMVSITSLLSPVSGFTNLSNMSLSVF